MVNEHYASDEVIGQIKQTLDTQGTVQLQQFLEVDIYNQLLQTIKETTLTQSINLLSYKYKTGPAPYLPEVEQFLQYLGLKVESSTLKVFTWKDYMLLHDNNEQLGEWEIMLDCTGEWLEMAGGEVTYTDGKGQTGTLPALKNSLTITKTDSLQRFVHYCNHHAKEKQRILLFITASSN